MEKKNVFVIPEMPSKTFVMLYKKLPDHFKVQDQDPYCLGTDPYLGFIEIGEALKNFLLRFDAVIARN
mgnify:CR=1 FL=1